MIKNVSKEKNDKGEEKRKYMTMMTFEDVAETYPFPGPCVEVVVALENSMLLAGAVTEHSGADSAHGGP